MQFRIENYEVKQTATNLSFDVTINNDLATVQYRLDTDDGVLVKSGTKEVPLEAVNIITQPNVDITALNAVLSEWGVVATEKL